MRLEVKDLCFSYTKKDTIKNISFSVESGDIVAILGINGVGKSTLLKCINKVHKPKSGEILLDGVNLLTLKPNEIAKKVGYVSQNSNYCDGSVFENVLLGRKPFIRWGLTEHDINIVDQVINDVNLAHIADKNINHLSGGERQKVAIARALAQESSILMFDEPTSNLDLKNQLDVLNVVKKVVVDDKRIALISIHDVNLALRYANKFLLLKDGSVYAFGDESVINEQSIKDIYQVDCQISNVDNHKMIGVK